MRLAVFGALSLFVAMARAGATPVKTFYIDSASGNDAAAGTSPAAAWRSLARMGRAEAASGCRILLKAGCTFQGSLELPGDHTEVGRYGNGPDPRIECPSGPAVALHAVQFCSVHDLELANSVTGVLAVSGQAGATRGLSFRRLRIHDIHGGLTGDDGGFLVRRAAGAAWFDDLRIEDCTIEHADRNGILVTDWPAKPDDPLSTRVVIRGNKLRDIGGDGIFILGCRGAVIERNELHYAHQRVGRGPGERACAGIWPQRSIGTLIQFNEVSHTAVGGKTVWDSEAFDDDLSCQGTVFQYNWSHDNAGGFLLNCGGAGTVARYNISQNDGTAIFTMEFDGVHDALIYNNTIYVGPGNKVLFARNTMGSPARARFANNIVYSDGEITFDFGHIREAKLERNCFWGKQTSGWPDGGKRMDPLLARPGGGSAACYKLRPGSPCRTGGVSLPDDGGRDFFGARLASGGRRSIGAHQR